MSHAAQAKLDQERREECRRDVLGFLVERQAVAHHPRTICNRLNAGHQHDYTLEEVEAALAFLVALTPALLAERTEKLGATKYFQATSDGVLAHERGA